MPYLPDLPVAVGRTAEMRCRMGRALPAVARFENGAVSRIFYWPITTMPAMPNTMACFSPLARGLVRSTVRPKTAAPIFAAGVAIIHRDALAWTLETDDAAPPIYRRVTVLRVTAIARAIPNCRFGGLFAGHGGSGYLASIEMYARLKALLETDDQARTRGAISCLLPSGGFVALAAAGG